MKGTEIQGAELMQGNLYNGARLDLASPQGCANGESDQRTGKAAHRVEVRAREGGFQPACDCVNNNRERDQPAKQCSMSQNPSAPAAIPAQKTHSLQQC